jgi:hypothetical protein
MRDGDLTESKTARFCISCNREHGILYVCPEYDQELQKKIEQDGIKFRETCLSGNIKITSNGQTKTWNEWIKDGDL